MYTNQKFVNDLVTGRFNTAYDPLSKCFVSIVCVDNSGFVPVITTRRLSDGTRQKYKAYQLTNFS